MEEVGTPSLTEGDGVHRPVTPGLLGQLSYATTKVPDPGPRPEPADEEGASDEDAAED